MEDTRWEQRLEAVTHILTHTTTNPSLHSQFFIATQVPCYLKWDYPPILCTKQAANKFPSLHLKWGISLFLKRVSRLGCPETSWRSKCPFQVPPPLVLAKGVEAAPAQWEDETMRECLRKRFRNQRYRSGVNPWVPFLVPNLLLLSLLAWDPFTLKDS